MKTPKTFEDAIPLLDAATSYLTAQFAGEGGAPDWNLTRSSKGFLIYCTTLRFIESCNPARAFASTPLAASIAFIESMRGFIERQIAGIDHETTKMRDRSAAFTKFLEE